MTFDLLSMAVLSISAFIVATTIANILGADRRQRIAVGVIGTFAGAKGRALLAKAFGRDLPAALLEDALVIALAFVALR